MKVVYEHATCETYIRIMYCLQLFHIGMYTDYIRQIIFSIKYIFIPIPRYTKTILILVLIFTNSEVVTLTSRIESCY